MRMNMIEFRSGRKVIKSVSSVDEAHTIARRLIEARNTDSFWEPNDREGLPVFGIMDAIMGASFDVYESMTVWLNGKKMTTLWSRGY